MQEGYLAALKRISLTWLIDFINLLLFIFSFGRLTISEGIYFKSFNKWFNWNLYFHTEPKVFLQPTSEQEICDYVRKASKVRVVAAGHSFNTGTHCNDLLINLDHYNKVIKFDTVEGLIRVQAGIRLRDFFAITEAGGWDIPVMGTANAQSLGGLVASDLHATGRESGFLSQQIEEIRIVNSRGVAETFTDKSDVFRSALGGIGAMGVVVEVTVRLVRSFLVRRVTSYVNREEAEAVLESLLLKHEHVGFFYIGGLHAKKIRLATYDKAEPHEKITTFVRVKNIIAQCFDLINGGFLLDFARFFPSLLNVGYFIWNNTFLSAPFINTAGDSFTTRLFFRHDEMEYGMPFENFRKAIKELTDFLDRAGHTSLMEVRFTVKRAQPKSLLGPGAGRETCWIEILPTLTHDSRMIFASTENIFEENGGRPHLGKFTTYHKGDMEKHYGEEAVARFHAAREKQDPERKFVNSFVYQVFFDESPSSPSSQAF